MIRLQTMQVLPARGALPAVWEGPTARPAQVRARPVGGIVGSLTDLRACMYGVLRVVCCACGWPEGKQARGRRGCNEPNTQVPFCC
jgi:hypothetical protein